QHVLTAVRLEVYLGPSHHVLYRVDPVLQERLLVSVAVVVVRGRNLDGREASRELTVAQVRSSQRIRRRSAGAGLVERPALGRTGRREELRPGRLLCADRRDPVLELRRARVARNGRHANRSFVRARELLLVEADDAGEARREPAVLETARDGVRQCDAVVADARELIGDFGWRRHAQVEVTPDLGELVRSA